MAYTLWRGVVGLVKPTRRPGSLEELIRLLPEGIGVVPLLLNVRQGNRKEFEQAIPHYERYVAELAEQGMDLIRVGGTPPFMLRGYDGEARLIRSWEKKYKTPIVTAALSARYGSLTMVVIGATAGMMAANLPAVIGGHYFAGKVPSRIANYIAAVIFAVQAVLTYLGIETF